MSKLFFLRGTGFIFQNFEKYSNLNHYRFWMDHEGQIKLDNNYFSNSLKTILTFN